MPSTTVPDSPNRITFFNFTSSPVSLGALIACGICVVVLGGWLFEIDSLNRVGPLLVLTIIMILGALALSNARSMNAAAAKLTEIENALAGATGRESAILQNSLDVICTFDSEGVFISVSPACLQVWGYTPNELLGRRFIEFVLPEDVTKTNAIGTEILAGNETSDFENRYLHKDGSVVYMRWTSSWSDVDQLSFSIAHDVTDRKNAHESLRQNETKFRRLLEAAPDAMVVVNSEGEIVLLNVQAEIQFGYCRDELVGRKVTSIIPEGFAERLVADDLRSASEALAQQIGTGIELSARRKDGSEFPIEIMLSPLDSAEGILVTAAIRDISGRKNAERYLARMEARYRGLLEAAPDAMVVVNEFGAIVLVNVQAEKQFGYSRDELIGQKMTNLIPEGFAERLVADDLRTASEALAQQIGTGIELSALRKDGTEFPIEIMLSPLESEDGILVTAAIRDISLRRAADLNLVSMEGRYRGLLEAAPDAMVVVNSKGEIVLVNVQAEKQFGYLRDELVGQKVTNIIPDGFAERLIADALRSDEDALAQSIGTGIELTALRNDGSEFPIELMLSPLASKDGILVTVAIRDITRRKHDELNLLNMVDELKRSNEELDLFASVASHDLQEPLRMVASYTQLLSRRYKGRLDSDADEFIAFAVDGADRMQGLIKDLLDYSRVGTKGKELQHTSSEEAFHQGLMNLRGAIADSKAVVTCGPLPDVMADEPQLIQLFQNLIGNGIKYQTPGEVPLIHVSAIQQKNKNWMFSVKDNGLGIEPIYFTRIFGMFQRLHKRDEFTGTGIGLAICKKIVERHGGNIAVESEPGRGSTFKFELSGSTTVL